MHIKWWYCSWPIAPAQCCFLFVFCYCMIVLFVDNLFFYWAASQWAVIKASLAALRLYGYFCDIVVMTLLSENKYDDDDEFHQNIFVAVLEIGLPVPTYPRIRYTKLFNHVVHRGLWTKVHEICYSYKAPLAYLPWKFDGGCSRKFLQNRKNRQILLHR